MTLLSLLVTLVVIALVFWAIRMILSAFGLGEPISAVVYVIAVVLVVLWLVDAVSGGGGHIGRITLP